MADAVRLYLKYVSISIRGQMQYRVSFALQTVGQFLVTAIDFVAIWALFGRFGNLRDWRLAEVALFYGMIHVGFAITDAASRGFDMFGHMVKRGEFDRLLLRPRSTAFQLAAQHLELKRLGRLSQGLFVLIYALAALDVSWTAGKVVLLIGSIAGASCMFYGLIVLQATAAFWTTETLEIMNTVTYGGTEAGSYPLSIYRDWFRKFFTFVVPLACVNYYPVMVILGRSGGSAAGTFGWFSPAVGPLFLALSLKAWKLGLRHYRSTGS